MGWGRGQWREGEITVSHKETFGGDVCYLGGDDFTGVSIYQNLPKLFTLNMCGFKNADYTSIKLLEKKPRRIFPISLGSRRKW